MKSCITSIELLTRYLDCNSTILTVETQLSTFFLSLITFHWQGREIKGLKLHGLNVNVLHLPNSVKHLCFSFQPQCLYCFHTVQCGLCTMCLAAQLKLSVKLRDPPPPFPPAQCTLDSNCKWIPSPLIHYRCWQLRHWSTPAALHSLLHPFSPSLSGSEADGFQRFGWSLRKAAPASGSLQGWILL